MIIDVTKWLSVPLISSLERCIGDRHPRSSLMIAIMLIGGVTLWPMSSFAGPGDGEQPANTPPPSHQVSTSSQVSTEHVHFGFMNDPPPDELSSTIEIEGERTKIEDAIKAFQGYRDELKELEAQKQNDPSQGDELDTKIGDLNDKMTKIKDALGIRLDRAADYLEKSSFEANITTRNTLAGFNRNYIGLQVALARRQEEGFNGFYDQDIDQLGQAVRAQLDQGRVDQAIRFQFVGSDSIHHIAADVFLDPKNKVASVVMMDSRAWSNSLRENHSELLKSFPEEYNLIVTHYETEAQKFDYGCQQFSMEFARDMGALDIHDAPLERLARKSVETARSGGLRILDVVDSSLDRRDGISVRELPPQIFRLANSATHWELYARERRDLINQDLVGGRIDQKTNQDQIEDVNTIQDEIEGNREFRKINEKYKKTNIAVDKSRAKGIRQLATYFHENDGDDLLRTASEEAAAAMTSDRAREHGARQAERYQEFYAAARLDRRGTNDVLIASSHDLNLSKDSESSVDSQLTEIDGSFEDRASPDEGHHSERVVVVDSSTLSHEKTLESDLSASSDDSDTLPDDETLLDDDEDEDLDDRLEREQRGRLEHVAH